MSWEIKQYWTWAGNRGDRPDAFRRLGAQNTMRFWFKGAYSIYRIFCPFCSKSVQYHISWSRQYLINSSVDGRDFNCPHIHFSLDLFRDLKDARAAHQDTIYASANAWVYAPDADLMLPYIFFEAGGKAL